MVGGREREREEKGGWERWEEDWESQEPGGGNRETRKHTGL